VKLGLVAALALTMIVAFGSADAQTQSDYEAILRARGVPESREDRAEELLESTRATVALPGPVDPDLYIVGPGDAFELLFSGGLSESQSVIVGPEGTASIPGWGVLSLAGLTITQCRAEVSKLLANRLKGVRWDFRLVAVRSLRVYVTGDVRQPGATDVIATSRVSDILSPAATTDRGSRRNIVVTRRDGTQLIADLALFERTGRSDLNPVVLDGDVLHVPPATSFLEIQGSVAHPGQYELGPRDSLMTLLDLAGGPLPATLTEGSLLLRWRSPTEAESVFFDLEDVYGGVFNPPLQEGDHVYSYFTPSYHELYQTTILGEVERPGTYPIDLGQTRLSDLVKVAGGFRQRADLQTIRLVRLARPAAGADVELERLSRLSRSEMTNAEYEVLRTRLTARREEHLVDWNRLQRDPNLDILVAGGDLVRVDPILASVRVEGEVRRPGLARFEKGFDSHDYIKLAGGYTNRADGRKMLVTRSATGQTLPVKDVIELSPGDMIWVPERPDRTFWQHAQTFIAVAAQLATVIIAVRSVR
jgi:protein involved in polysaccharide export with SLBB domain